MITAKNINHFYENEQVLFDINLEIKKGEFLALVGSSGSGKSTLLSILSTLLKPTNGELLFDNLSYSDIKDINRFRRENVGFVFQFHYLIEYLSVEENILLASKDREYLNELLEYLHITELKDKLPNQISGGAETKSSSCKSFDKQAKGDICR